MLRGYGLRERPPLRLMLLAVALVLASWLVGCGQRDAPQPGGQGSATQPVDTVLMAYLSKARSIHHQADMLEEDKDLRGAVAALEKLTATPVPGGTRPMPEAQEVLADTYARMAELRGQLGDHDAAERDVQQGLLRAPKVSFFEGHLIEVRGVIGQQRAKALLEQGDRQGAEKARKKAFEDFDQAVRIQDQVIERLLPDAGGQTR